MDNKKRKYTRMTNQKLQILEFIQETDKHPTAQEVYQEVRKKLPKISKATVYRNLKSLAEKGSIKKLDIGQKEIRWDGNANPHHHFICNKCDRIIEVNLADIWQIEERLEEKYSLKLEDYSIIARGLCDFCQRH